MQNGRYDHLSDIIRYNFKHHTIYLKFIKDNVLYMYIYMYASKGANYVRSISAKWMIKIHLAELETLHLNIPSETETSRADIRHTSDITRYSTVFF